MRLKAISFLTVCFCLVFAPISNAQFGGYNNQGLVGVGRIPANSFDGTGAGVDTLGGVFSAMTLDSNTIQRTGNVYSSILYGLPDRGFGDGAQDYRPRIQRFDFSITPYYGTTPVPQNQITLRNTGTLLNSYGAGTLFTGFDGNDLTAQLFPQSTAASLGLGRRSLDAEGIALRLNDGGYWISDEYGPNIYRFDRAGVLRQTLPIPTALVPKSGATFPRQNNFTGAAAPTVGRTNNRGMEGLSLTPDGKKLVAMLQSPTVQDSGGASTNNSLNTRILVYDVEEGSPRQNQMIGEYVYQLTNQGSAAGRSTPISELYALNGYQFLILERDNIGLGGTDGAPRYKKVNLADVSAATNIAGSGYDLEAGAPGSLQFPATTIPTGIIPAARQDFVDLLDSTQLTKFGLNANATRDQNSLSEKWEGLALLPGFIPNSPNEFLLLVGNDNDFKSANVFHNGVIVGTNNPTVDNMVLAYRVTLPISRQTATRKRDFDGDGKSDLSVYRNGTWFVQNSGNQVATIQQFGLAGDRLAAADYDGDDKTDFAVFRNGLWYILNSQNNSVSVSQFGLANDIPVSADYDNDGKADLAVFRPSNGTWYVLNSFNGRFRSTQFGQSGDIPVIGDYNGDSTTDIAYWRPSTGTWNVRTDFDGFVPMVAYPAFGLPTDIPVQGDYNGDGFTEIAVYRPSEGNWYFLLGSNNFTVQRFGTVGDVPVTGDYDGDGRNDLAVFRTGNWHILNSSNAAYRVQQWGVAADLPIQ